MRVGPAEETVHARTAGDFDARKEVARAQPLGDEPRLPRRLGLLRTPTANRTPTPSTRSPRRYRQWVRRPRRRLPAE